MAPRTSIEPVVLMAMVNRAGENLSKLAGEPTATKTHGGFRMLLVYMTKDVT